MMKESLNSTHQKDLNISYILSNDNGLTLYELLKNEITSSSKTFPLTMRVMIPLNIKVVIINNIFFLEQKSPDLVSILVH